MRARSGIWLAASVLCACAITRVEVGTEIPEVAGLEVGVTTVDQALADLGPPRWVQRQFDGELYTWRILRGRSRSLTILPVFVRAFFWEDSLLLRDDVALLFDRDGILRGVGRRVETREPEPESR